MTNRLSIIAIFSIHSLLIGDDVTITFPPPNETLFIGHTYTITWTSVDTDGSDNYYFNIQRFTGSSYPQACCFSLITNDGSYSWEVPDIAEGNYYLNVQELSGEYPRIPITITTDSTAPTISSVSSPTADGTYGIDSTIAITITFSETVTVTGTPQLTIETSDIDAVVNYSSGSGSETLTFNYTVVSGETSSDLDYASTSALALNSGTIKDVVGHNAALTLPTVGGANSLGGNKALVIDGNVPIISAISPNSYVNHTKVSYTLSETIASGTITWTQTGGSEDTNSPHANSLTGDELNTGAHSGITLTNNPTLVDGAIYTVSFDATDAAGNSATTVSNTSLTYDVTAPVISSTSPAASSYVNHAKVSYTLSEAIASGTVTWTQTGGSADSNSPHAKALSGDELNTGAHTDITLINSPTLIDGAIYTVTFDITDLADNSVTASNTDITYDITEPIISAISPSSSTIANTVKVSYTLSKQASSGTITWISSNGPNDPNSPHTQALSGDELNAGVHTDITLANSPTLVENCIYTITFDAIDLAGSKATPVSTTNIMYHPTIPIATPFFEYETSGSIEGGISKLDSTAIYVTASGDGIYRFDDDGNKLYKLDVSGEVKSVTTITPAHNVYIGSTDNNLYSFNSVGVSNPNWPLALGSEANASVAVDIIENIYIGTHNGIFQAVSPENQIIWSFNAGASVYCSAAINSDAKLFFANEEGMLYCFDLNAVDSSTPSPLWYYPIGEGVKSSVALDGNYLYVTTTAGKLIKLQYLTGETGPTKIWEFEADTIITSSPIIGSNHEVYFGTHSGMIYSINADGTQKWTYNTYAPVVSTGALAEYGTSMDRLYIGNDSGYAFALSLSDGTLYWVYSSNASIKSAFLYDEGVVHFGTTDGKVLKIQDTEPMNAALARGLVETASIWGTFQGNNYRTGNLSTTQGALSTHPETSFPSKYALGSSYPNPFNPVTSINYSLPEIANISLTVYDMTGREISVLYNGPQTPGYHTINWDASEQSSGIYFVKMIAGEYINTQKLMLVK